MYVFILYNGIRSYAASFHRLRAHTKKKKNSWLERLQVRIEARTPGARNVLCLIFFTIYAHTLLKKNFVKTLIISVNEEISASNLILVQVLPQLNVLQEFKSCNNI